MAQAHENACLQKYFRVARDPDLINFQLWGVTIPFALTSFTEGFADHFNQSRSQMPKQAHPREQRGYEIGQGGRSLRRLPRGSLTPFRALRCLFSNAVG